MQSAVDELLHGSWLWKRLRRLSCCKGFGKLLVRFEETANGTTHVDYCHGRCFDHHGSFTKTHCLDIYTSSARDAESRTPTVRKVFRAETKVRVEWYGVGGAGG